MSTPPRHSWRPNPNAGLVPGLPELRCRWCGLLAYGKRSKLARRSNLGVLSAKGFQPCIPVTDRRPTLRLWLHECVLCGTTFHGPRCRIVCDLCFAQHAQATRRRALSRGRCLVCGRKVPRNFLYCPECRHQRHLDAVKRHKRFHYTGELSRELLREQASLAEPDPIVVTPSHRGF